MQPNLQTANKYEPPAILNEESVFDILYNNFITQWVVVRLYRLENEGTTVTNSTTDRYFYFHQGVQTGSLRCPRSAILRLPGGFSQTDTAVGALIWPLLPTLHLRVTMLLLVFAIKLSKFENDIKILKVTHHIILQANDTHFFPFYKNSSEYIAFPVKMNETSWFCR